MNFRFAHLRGQSLPVKTVFVLILGLFALLLVAPPDGRERSPLFQFIGRFHPLSVHLPIALLIVVPLFELAGRRARTSDLHPSANFLLAIAACSSILSVSLGWCLARTGGYSGSLLTQHMWGGLSVALAAWVCWVLRTRTRPGTSHRAYAATLAGVIALVTFTGYRGGQLSHGENHLTEFMPEDLRNLLGVRASSLVGAGLPGENSGTFFGTRIEPLFAGHCVTCHGQSKHKAGLRLDSYQALLHGSKRGPVIKPGDPKSSELFHRISLPPSDDDFMPADNKRPLSAGEVKLLERWIASGAFDNLPAGGLIDFPENQNLPAPAAEVNFDEPDPKEVSRQRAEFAATVAELQKRFPNILDYESRASGVLALIASGMGSRFGDKELSAFAPLNERIAVADFSGTAITDQSAGIIGGMKHLRKLRLMHTRISDQTLRSLGALDQLESLNIFDTPVTSASLPVLVRLTKLRQFYVGETRIPADTRLPEGSKVKMTF